MKDNKLIAEFMGLSHCEEGWITIPNENRNGVSENEISNDLQYHTSWDWLMPVVEKIRVPYNNTEITGEKYEDIISVLAEGCVEANQLQVYEAVVEFIKTYNDER